MLVCGRKLATWRSLVSSCASCLARRAQGIELICSPQSLPAACESVCIEAI